MRCRTAALGGHKERCTACGDERPAYNSCRDRHCPKCQALTQARWVERQAERVLPLTSYHVVFTLPAKLRGVARRLPRQVYDLLFAAASATLLELGRDEQWLGAELGMTAVLHTWSRDLSLHPHVHCIVTAGGLDAAGKWRHSPTNFLFPVRVMGALFRGKFLAGLRKTAREEGVVLDDQVIDKLWRTNWNVYSKAPLAGPDAVFRAGPARSAASTAAPSPTCGTRPRRLVPEPATARPGSEAGLGDRRSGFASG